MLKTYCQVFICYNHRKMKNTLISLVSDLKKRNLIKSQKDLATKLGNKPATITDWLKGRSTPTTIQLIKLSKLFNISITFSNGNLQYKFNRNNPPAFRPETKELLNFLKDNQTYTKKLIELLSELIKEQ